MKYLIFLCFLLLSVNIYSQQESSIEDFVSEHQGLEENESGEITPINDRKSTKKSVFLLKRDLLMLSLLNIIWDNYQTFISPYDRYHYHTFIVKLRFKGMID